MRLWRCELPCLQGFYDSTVVVVADDRFIAEAMVCNGVRAWLDERGREYGSVPGSDAMAWEPEWPAEIEKLMARVRAETSEKLTEIEAGWIVNVRS